MNVRIPSDYAAEYPRHSPLQHIWSTTRATTLALLLIVLLGGSLRFMSLLTWDGGTGQHPDERFFSEVTTSVRIPTSWDGYFDSAQSPANPRNVGKTFYVYGTFPVLLTRLTGVLLTPREMLPESYTYRLGEGDEVEQRPNPEQAIPDVPLLQQLFNPEGRNLTDYYEVYKVGRVLVVLFDLGSLLLVFLIGQQLFDRRVGLLAALLSALTVMAIQQSHFYVDPIFSTFFTLLALSWGVRAAQHGSVAAFALLGISVGLAMANRITLAAVGVVAIVAAVQHARVVARHQGAWGILNHFLVRGVPLLFLAGFLCLLTFRIVQPYAFLGSTPGGPVLAGFLGWMHGWGFFDVRLDPRFVENMRSVKDMVTGVFDFPPSLQWVGRTDYLFPLKNMVVWGMGPALGVAAWAGWLLLGWRLFRGHERQQHPSAQGSLVVPPAALVLWFWVACYFAWQGGQFAITMRYMLPIYGALIVPGAWLLVSLWDRGSAAVREQRATTTPEPAAMHTRMWHWLLVAGRWLPLVVVVATLAWAYAFTRIYTQPHSRVLAAHWVLENIPPGARITTEVWDDPLPLQVSGINPWGISYYGVDTAPYAEDEPQKFFAPGSGLLDQLEQADYIALSSNRVYGSISRLPMRYPATIRYYHHLFNGDLGFELVADITSYPQLFGIPIPDQSAEEAFTVYDHPRVLIFRKTDDFSRERAKELITGDVNWDEVYRLPVAIADQNATALRLTESEWPRYRQGSGVEGWLLGRNAQWLAVPVWLLVLEVLGLALFALLFRLLPWLPDRGFSLARTLALLLVAWAAWMLGSLKLLAFSPLSVWLCAAPLLVAGAWVAWRSRAEMLAFWRARRGVLLTAEALYLLAFAAMLLIRWLNPDLWHPARGGEKPMDFAYLNAVLHSAAFPPYDPWFAGGSINYYYFGFVVVGALIHMTQVVPAVAYNLAVPTLFALTALGAWGAAYNVLAPRVAQPGSTRERHSRAAALLAPLFVLVLGNLAQALWFVNGYAAANRERAEWLFWDATRLVGGVINEFPFFTFLFGDLHAHMMVMPFTLAVMGVLVALTRTAHHPPGTPLFTLRSASVLLLLGLLLGTLRTTNTWDYPPALALSVATLALVVRAQHRRGQRSLVGAWWAWALAVVGVLVVERLLFLPFSIHFATESTGVQWVYPEDYTPLLTWLRINGLWLLLLVSGSVALAYRSLRRRTSLDKLIDVVLLALAVATMLAIWFMLRGYLPSLPHLSPLRIVLLVLLFWAAWVVWRQRHLPPRLLLPMLWAGMALAINLGTELVFVRGDVGRMNTVFKFGLHAWILAALAAAVVLPWLWQKAGAWERARGGAFTVAAWVWRGAVVLLIGAALVYPLTATPARIADRYTDGLPHTLDGTAFMAFVEGAAEGERFPLAEDAAAIAWLQQHTDGIPIVLEAHQPSYQWGGRVATFSGRPTLLGWEWHQIQQRSAVQATPVINNRRERIAEIYNTPDPATALELLRRYGVEYLYLGGVERAIYAPEGIAKFAALEQQGHLLPVFRTGETTIYEVAAPGYPAIFTTDLPVQPPHKETTLPLLLDQPVGDLPVVGGYAWNEWASNHSWAALLTWLVALYGLALLGLPLAVLLFGQWRDGGGSWARLVGLLALGYIIWLPTSLNAWSYTHWTLAAGAILLLMLDAVVVVLLGRGSFVVGLQQLGAHLHQHSRMLMVSEGVFLVGFAAFVGVRALNPDLWHPFWGGEKPMEVGFLNAVLRSPVMPPPDPFFSDGYINYYYYGFYLFSLLIRATGIATHGAYNLIIPTLFALTLTGGYTIVAQLTGRVRYGMLGAAFLALLGNLSGPFVVGWSRGLNPAIAALRSGGLAQFGEHLGDWYVGASRIIPHTINEFPFWSFLFADLHPHMMALPITLLVVALAYHLVWSGEQGQPAAGSGALPFIGHPLALLAMVVLALGALAVTNSWDFPTCVLLLSAALMGRAWRAAQGTRWHALFQVVRSALLAALLAIVSLALYMPFFDHYHVFVSGIGTVREVTDTHHYLVLYGLFLAVLLPLLAGMVWRFRSVRAAPHIAALYRAADARLLPSLAMLLLLSVPLLFGLRLWLALLLLVGVVLLVMGGRGRFRLRAATWFTLLLALVGWAVSLGIEVVFIRDHLLGDAWYRMNTVFKFGYQIWALLALAAAASLPHLVRGLHVVPRAVFMTMLAVLVAIAAVFPVVGTPSRLANRFHPALPPTLDGLAFLEYAQFEYDCRQFGGCQPGMGVVAIDLAPDAAAIAWLNENIDGMPVVLQSDVWFYRAYGVRVASNTGLPTIVSPLHASEQHNPEITAQRSQDVNTIFTTRDRDLTLRLLAKYGVHYIYVGPVEQAIYAAEGLQKFQEMVGTYLEVAYEQDGVVIYEVQTIPPFYSQPLPSDPADVFAAPPPDAETSAALEALEELEQQVAADPTSAVLAYGLAERYRDANRLDDAARVLAVAADANPDDVALHHLWGDILTMAGRHDEAEQAYLRAAQSSPTAGNWNKLGMALLARGEHERAELFFTMALTADPQVADPYYGLGVLYSQQGKRQEALDALERYVELAPDGSLLGDVQRLMADLRSEETSDEQ